MALLKNMKSTAISTLGEKFENVGGPALVALLTTIDPAVGSTAVAIGGLLSYGSSHRSKLKQEYLAIQIRKSLEAHAADISHINENLHEAVALAIEGVQSAVSKEKIERFAKIVAGHVVHQRPWTDTATALRAITSLEDIHIEILSAASLHIDSKTKQAKFYIETPDFPKPAFVDGRSAQPTFEIRSEVGGIGHAEAQIFCTELTARGFLHDNGQGSFIKGPVYTLTDAGIWLLSRIEIINKH